MSKVSEVFKLKCEMCQFRTSNEESFSKHVLKCHHAKKFIFFCNKCKTNFESLVELHEHTTNFKCVFVANPKVEVYAEPPIKRFRRDQVNGQSTSKSAIQVIESSTSEESDDDDDDVKCPHCNLFLSPPDLQKHMQTHVQYKNHKANSHPKAHIIRYIPEEIEKGATHACQFCRKTFYTAEATKKHEAMAHYTKRFKNLKLQRANLQKTETAPPKPVDQSKESIEKFYDETFYELLEEIESRNAEECGSDRTSESIIEMPVVIVDDIKDEEIESVEMIKKVSKKKAAKPRKIAKNLKCINCNLEFSSSLDLWAHLHLKHFK